MLTADFRCVNNPRTAGFCPRGHTSTKRAAGFCPRGASYGRNVQCRLFTLAFSMTFVTSVAHAQTETIRVDLKLRTGGALSGLVVDHTEHGLVIVHERTPYVFAWDELESGSAYATRQVLVAFDRGGAKHLSAEDHFQLGLFTLRNGRRDLAANEFRKARKLDNAYRRIIRDAFDEYRRSEAASKTYNDPLEDSAPIETIGTTRETGLAARVEAQLARTEGATLAPGPLADSRAQVLKVYKTFGAKVQEVIGKDVVLIDSDHFLIWTDFEPQYRNRLTDWCESMYAALCSQFDLNPTDNVFLAKCPVFCWRSKSRFLAFARQFDGYDAANAVGYARSIERNGHVHIVLLRSGRSEADFDRFACTLVHEGTHAFLHRLYTSRLIPHWINEGYADLMAERVLKDRCHTGETAELLSRQFARYDWPIAELLRSAGPIEVHQYPLAHSVVAHLEAWGRERFAGFLKDLKAGKATESALAANYDGLTLAELESRWLSAVRRADPLHNPPEDNTAVLPWSTDP